MLSANNTRVGLASYFYSNDVRQCWRVGKRLESGQNLSWFGSFWISSNVVCFDIGLLREIKMKRWLGRLVNFLSLCIDQCCGSGIRCLFHPWIGDPGWVKNQDPDPGSGMNILDRISESLETFFWVKILPYPVSGNFLTLDPGSGNNIPDP